ncbi:DUF4868 domain-containing protein [Oscillospiraceae bacterium OttesenSCG-928-G22]|nr:DUF4868 domain-containing protein [Oscillospiraceae bacterium OttesenSCG-928-G22]
MSKALLEERLAAAKTGYVWTLYFINTRKQRNAGLIYETAKIRFRNNNYISAYAEQLINCVQHFNVEPISSVETYDGYNTKVSCDTLDVTSDLLGDGYTNLITSLTNCGEASPLKERYQGYILDGKPNIDGNGDGITFIKMANPMVALNTKKTVMFKKAQDEALDIIDETFCRLYLVADSLIIDGRLYNFNHAFEKLFNVEQTIKKVKTAAIQKIIDAGIIHNTEDFANYAQSCHARTFVTLNDDRVENAKQQDRRQSISEAYRIPLSEEGNFVTSSVDEAGNLVKYLCFKVFEEAETNDILEASSVTKWSATTA